jgi:hypothetical protein
MWKLDIGYINTEDNCVVLLTVHDSGSEELVFISENRKYNLEFINDDVLGIGDI